MWYLYIIRCAENSLYTGITKDVSKRIAEHNRKTGCNYTRARRPVELVYQESHPTRSSALKREIRIKQWPRPKKLDLIDG